MSEIKKPAVLIAGPTAGGKSSIGMFLARKWNGVIVNADSMQVYRQMRILTARPGKADETEIAHRLYGHVSAAEAYSAGKWLDDVKGVLSEIWQAGQLPIIVGGTGLYFKMLLEGVAPVPDIDPDTRAYWRTKAEADGPEVLHKILSMRDPVMAGRLQSTDPQRLVRALEVLDGTGRSLAAWQNLEPTPPILQEAETMRFVLAPPREVLYGRIEARFDAMLEMGALDEAREVKALGLAPNLPAMKALGLKPLILHLEGELALEKAVEDSKTASRRYAKRQMTWLRGNMISWRWVVEQDMESQMEKIFSFIQ